MLRRALTYQLILAVAVGPLLCCCTTGTALASAPADSHRHHAPVKATSPCCAHKQSHSKPAPAKKQTPVKPAQPDKKCPCKDGTGKAGVIQSDSAQAPLADFLRTLALDSVVPFGAPAISEVITCRPGVSDWKGRADGARRIASELLYAHHNLRC